MYFYVGEFLPYYRETVHQVKISFLTENRYIGILFLLFSSFAYECCRP